MKKILFLCLVFFFSFSSYLFAEINLRCEVDKRNIGISDQLVYKLIVSFSEKNIPAPKLPGFGGFSILSEAQSSTISFGKTGPRTLLVYTYILVPLQVGKFKIAPATITQKNKTYACEEIEIEITETGERSGQKPQERVLPPPEKGPPDSGQPKITL